MEKQKPLTNAQKRRNPFVDINEQFKRTANGAYDKSIKKVCEKIKNSINYKPKITNIKP